MQRLWGGRACLSGNIQWLSLVMFNEKLNLQENFTDNQKIILAELDKNNKTTTNKLADMIGISQRKIKENIAKLKELGMIVRIGTTRTSYWKIIK